MHRDLKNQDIRQKQQSNKLNKDLYKMVCIKKKKKPTSSMCKTLHSVKICLHKVLIKVVNNV